MANFEIKAVSICAAGDHVRLQVSVNGTPRAVYDAEVSEILKNIEADEAIRFALMLARMVAVGKTKAQTKTALQAGVTVSM
jgi:hypothetical protein